MKQTSDAAERNREPIRQALEKYLPASGLVLEVASGTGEHAVYLARHFSSLTWQPSDRDPSALASITAWQEEAGLPNLMKPIVLDVTSQPWPIAKADAVVCINMVHVAPLGALYSLFGGAARIMSAGGVLYLYGPFRFHGTFTAESNKEFDLSLRAQDASWGVRDIRELTVAATRTGFGLEHTIAMPANNHSLIFRRRALLPPTGKFVVS
jgi:SAM-dependent methyltransferase